MSETTKRDDGPKSDRADRIRSKISASQARTQGKAKPRKAASKPRAPKSDGANFFDRAIDELFTLLGLGPRYLAETNNSMFALEAHISYLREIKAGERVYVDSQILDHDPKRIHLFQTLIHAEEGFVSATGEIMQLHVSMTTRRSAPFPPDRMALVEACAVAHAGLPRPERAGRRIGIPR